MIEVYRNSNQEITETILLYPCLATELTLVEAQLTSSFQTARIAGFALIPLQFLFTLRIGEAVRHEHNHEGDGTDGDAKPPVRGSYSEADSTGDPNGCGRLNASDIVSTLEDDCTTKETDS